MAKVDLRPILDLPVSERLRVLEEIWDSIAVNPDAIPVPESHRTELRRRLDEYRKNPDEDRGSPWAEVKARILKRS